LVKALQDVGDSKWFRVIERGDIDNPDSEETVDQVDA
jgi:hypothetical protein